MFDCVGLVWVDFFYVEEIGELFFNEVNIMFGFIIIFMYFKLFEVVGLSYSEFVICLVELVLEEW